MNKIPGLAPAQAEETETESALRRLLSSERFRKNSSLRNLLEYLVVRSLRGEQTQLKESTVAMDVFGRPHDFDSRIDNIVRVQAHRLRKLLASYYEEEGAEERIRFSLPRGGYIPHIEEVAIVAEEVAVAAAPVVAAPAVSKPPRNLSLYLALFCAGALVAFAAAALFRPVAQRAPGLEDPRRGALNQVWGSLLKPGVETVVSYSNPVFLVTGPPGRRVFLPYNGVLSMPAGARIDTPPSDLNRSDAAVAGGSAFTFSDGWTGVGEVAAMQRLTALLSPDVNIRVLRSRAVSYADLKDSNVIFLGSPWANEMQKRVNLGNPPLVNDNEGNILNLKPRRGEPARFRAQTDAGNEQLISTYGLFSVLPGVAPGTKILISAGVNTYGTAGAMEFMTHGAGAKEVLGTLQGAKYFQAVIRSEMIRGEPVRSRLVLARAVAATDLFTVH